MGGTRFSTLKHEIVQQVTTFGKKGHNRPLVKTKSSYKLVQVDKHISYATFRGKSLQSIVPDPSVYGTHSFRSGGASRAANSGVSDRVFQRHGRWKSVAAKDGYVKDDMSSRLAVSKSLGL